MIKRRKDGNDNIEESIRTGAYFVEARKWYFILFSNPIAERSFYLVTAIIAIICLCISVMAVRNILPLNSEFPFFVRNNDTMTKTPKIIKLRKDHTETQDFALMRFYVGQYLTYRESYAQGTFALSEKFIANYSDQTNFQTYQQLMNMSNPASPRLLYADAWTKRSVTINNVQINKKIQPMQAIVKYTALASGVGAANAIEYSADIRFLYSPLQVVSELDSVTGETITKFKEPEFQVVGYQAQQTGASVAPIGYNNVR